jgi:thiol-disulfide isomerase/thioredoxin
MSLKELSSPTQLTSFLQQHAVCLVTFSAHWCGPCKASKPNLEQMAKESTAIPFGITYESDLGEELHSYNVRAFPTYVCFVSGKEVQRVEGVNFAGIQQMVAQHEASATKMNLSSGAGAGNALGGGGDNKSPEEARALRLARFGGGAAAVAASPAAEPASKPLAEAAVPMDTTTTEDAQAAGAADATMADATAAPAPAATSVAVAPAPAVSSLSLIDKLNPEAVQTLTESMGFALIRAQKGLLFSSSGTVESAVEWLMEHQDDDDIDAPIPENMPEKAESYKCNECEKVLSNMANLELHANKTGHSDFEESTQAVTPLTKEEKAAKMLEIKSLLQRKRTEREETEKADGTKQEIQRRFMGKEMNKTKEEMEKDQRKREILAIKREKTESHRERLRIRAELEKDKRERQANKGKLHSTLGVDGYNPSAIQYNVGGGGDDDETQEPAAQKPKKAHAAADPARIEEYIKKVSSYRAGGDGGRALKVLKAYVGNVADHPEDPKYQTINMDNTVFKTKIKPFIGAKALLLAVGFSLKEGDSTQLVLNENADRELIAKTKAFLVAAVEAFGK